MKNPRKLGIEVLQAPPSRTGGRFSRTPSGGSWGTLPSTFGTPRRTGGPHQDPLGGVAVPLLPNEHFVVGHYRAAGGNLITYEIPCTFTNILRNSTLFTFLFKFSLSNARLVSQFFVQVKLISHCLFSWLRPILENLFLEKKFQELYLP